MYAPLSLDAFAELYETQSTRREKDKKETEREKEQLLTATNLSNRVTVNRPDNM